MSSQPYVYKPPVRRVSQNPSVKSQILPQTTTTNVKPQGLKVTKLSDLGSSSLFKGLDNLNPPSITHNKPRIQQVSRQKKEQIKQVVKDRSVSGRYQRRQPNQSIQQPVSTTIQQPISRLTRQQQKVVEKKEQTQSVTNNLLTNAHMIRKPITRTVKEQLKEQIITKPNLLTRQNQIQTNKLQSQKEQTQTQQNNNTDKYSYKPALKRTSTPLNNKFTSQIITRNQSAILTKQPQRKQQSKQILPTTKSNIYERKRQRQSSIIDLNLQVNTKTKIFQIQPKKQQQIQLKNEEQISSVEKIPTSKSISSSNNIISPLKQQKVSTNQNTSIISQPKKYTYQRPKTKAQLVRENQLKKTAQQQQFKSTQQKQQQEIQKISQTKIQEKKPYYSRSTILTRVQKEQTQQQNKSTLIGDKQYKPYPYQYGKKTKQQLINQNKTKTNQPHIIVSGQIFKTQDKKEETKVQKQSTSSYTYQPAYRRTQRQQQESKISSQQQVSKISSQQETIQNKSNLLIESRKGQYPYQRRTINQQKIQTTTTQQPNIIITIKPSPVPYSRSSKVETKQQQVQPQIQTKKDIPPIAFSLLNILFKKKLNSNFRQSFVKIKQQIEKNNKKQKSLQSLTKKSILLSQTYLNYLQLQAFNLLKKNLISQLTGTQTTTSNKLIALKIGTKPKQSKQDQQLKNLTETMKKPLCYQLSQLLNSKLKFVLKSKIFASFNQQNYSSKKSPIFSTLFKLFSTKEKCHLKNTFSKLKFSYSHIQKTDDEDVLPLFETRNKKLSKQEIIKHFQSIIQTQPVLTPTNRASLLQKTPQKVNQTKKQGLKNKNLVGSSLSKIESQKVIQIKSKILSLEKQLKEQQKTNKEKKNEVNSKKIELRRQIDEMKRQNEMRKRENEELKEKLKRFEVISFSDRKEPHVSYDLHELVTPIKQSSSLMNRQKSKGENNKYLDVLCELYVSNILKSQEGSQRLDSQNMQTFLNSCQRLSPLILEGLNFVMKKDDLLENTIAREDLQRLARSKELIEERLLIEQNTILKSQIEEMQSKMIGENEPIQQQDGLSKSVEQIEAIKSLVRNYIKQRYLWQWIRKSRQKI